VIDDGPGLQAIAQLLRVQERTSRLMGLDAPTRRAVDVITHDVFMEAVVEMEAELAAMGALTSTVAAQIWSNGVSLPVDDTRPQ
jgi:hypothetical protein